MSLHLLHPGLVHLTVALLMVGAVAEAAGLLGGRQGMARFGGTAVLFGAASLVPTIASGYLAANTVRLSDAAHQALERHEKVGLTLAAFFLAMVLWKAARRGKIPPGEHRAYAVLLLLGAALVAWSAILGGDLVYGHGVGTPGADLTTAGTSP